MAKLLGGTTVYGLLSTTGVVYASGGNSDRWNTAYNTATLYQTASSSYATIDFTNSKFFPISGGTITGDTRFNSNVTIQGNLTATGTTTFNNTVFSTTSAVSVVHVGSGPALWVGNNGTGDIASFYDIDQGIEILHVGGNNGTFPNVGVKTSSPNVDFTVNGAISASSIIYSLSGNSNQWNSTYSTVQSNSATWGSGGGGGGSSTKETITQVGHGFAAKDAIKFASGVYAKAQADSSANAEVVGIVESVAGDNFVLVYGGRISSLSGLSAGEAYFLDATTAGALTITSPTGTNISKPLLIATSTSSGVVVNMRGSVGGAGGSTSALNYTYLGAFTATAAALVAADNIFNDTLYDSYIWELSATPATNNVSLIVYLRNATPANAATVAKTGGYYSGIATGAGTTSVAGSLNTAMVNTKPCSFRGTLIFESATNNYGFFQGLSPQVADTYSLNYGYAFSDTTLRQGIAFGYSAGNVASANLKVWGRKR